MIFFSASNDQDQTGCTRVYLSTDRVSYVREELLKAARPRGILCVCCCFLSTFLFTSKTAQGTSTLRPFCMETQKENS